MINKRFYILFIVATLVLTLCPARVKAAFAAEKTITTSDLVNDPTTMSGSVDSSILFNKKTSSKSSSSASFSPNSTNYSTSTNFNIYTSQKKSTAASSAAGGGMSSVGSIIMKSVSGLDNSSSTTSLMTASFPIMAATPGSVTTTNYSLWDDEPDDPEDPPIGVLTPVGDE